MVRRSSVLLLPLLISASILLLVWGTITYAQGTVIQEGPAPSAEPAGVPATNSDAPFLLVLPLPRLDEVRPDAQPFLFEALLFQAAQPVLEELARLQAEGLVADFTLLPGEHAVRVTPATPAGLRALRRLAGPTGLVPATDAGAACAAKAAKAALSAVEGALWAQQARRTAGPALLRTRSITLTLEVYVRQGSQYSSVNGSTLPNTPVTMTLRSPDGTVKATETTTSTASGFYSFRPTWQPCEFTWVAVPGDTVEVTAAGKTISTTVAPISAFADPTKNTVSGVTAPNRNISILAFQTSAVCDVPGSGTTTTSDGGGGFSATVPGGFDRSGLVVIWVDDPNGDATTSTVIEPPYLRVGNDGTFVSGALRPRSGFVATLKRGSTVISQVDGSTGQLGWFYTSFTQTAQTGDIIEVVGGDVVVTTTFVSPRSLMFDPDNDRITGTIDTEGAGRRIRFRLTNRLAPTWKSGCADTTVNADGSFVLDFAAGGYDVQRGDTIFWFGASVYDDQGNSQQLTRQGAVPYLEVYPGQRLIKGYWLMPASPITLTLWSSGGMLKSRVTAQASSWNSSFQHQFTSTIKAGDRVAVSDGAVTMTVSSVPTLTALLDAGANTVSGAAPTGSSLVVQVTAADVGLDGPTSSFLVYTPTVSGGRYSVDLSDVDVKSQSEADVFFREPGGHIVRAYSHALDLNVEIDDEDTATISGYVPKPESPVIVELRRGGTVQQVITLTASWDGFFSWSPTGKALPGDVIGVRPVGVPSDSVSIPTLTVQDDPANNRVTGKAPANGLLEVALGTYSRYMWWEWTTFLQAAADGTYAANFDGLISWPECREAQVGQCTRSKVTYYTDEGYAISRLGTPPPDVSPDAYEDDNTFTSAVPYTGIQSRTLHAVTDTDWISFTVGAQDVGITLTLMTVNLGPNANTVLYLYDTDGTTLLAKDTSATPSSQIVWRPTAPGTYYVKVAPYSTLYTQVCGATYDFFIARYRVNLPLVARQQ